MEPDRTMAGWRKIRAAPSSKRLSQWCQEMFSNSSFSLRLWCRSISGSTKCCQIHLGNNKVGQMRCQRFLVPIICQSSKFVIGWQEETFAANLCSTKSHSQVNIDKTLLSICSFCKIWYRSLSPFYSATAKTQCMMGSSGKVRCFCIFSDFHLKSSLQLAGHLDTYWLWSIPQEKSFPQQAVSGPL